MHTCMHEAQVKLRVFRIVLLLLWQNTKVCVPFEEAPVWGKDNYVIQYRRLYKIQVQSVP